LCKQRLILKEEIRQIQIHKWIESEKAGRDIGHNAAALDWINKYAKSFREYAENISFECQKCGRCSTPQECCVNSFIRDQK